MRSTSAIREIFSMHFHGFGRLNWDAEVQTAQLNAVLTQRVHGGHLKQGQAFLVIYVTMTPLPFSYIAG